MNKEKNYNETYDANFFELLGKTITAIERQGNDLLKFATSDGAVYQMLYYEDCCASCSIEDVCGDLEDLIGNPVLLAEEVSSTEPDAELQARRDKEKADCEAAGEYYYGEESETWTFYKLSTIKGSVTIRWYGSSNGYYSESVTFEQTQLGEGQ